MKETTSRKILLFAREDAKIDIMVDISMFGVTDVSETSREKPDNRLRDRGRTSVRLHDPLAVAGAWRG